LAAFAAANHSKNHPTKKDATMLKRTDATPVPEPPETSPAGSSNALPTVLNNGWRVVNDPLQWILQRRNSKPDKKHSGWANRSYCRTREGLLRCVREYCGIVDLEALRRLEMLPEWHD